jgi:hypothetical protein
MKTIWKFPPAVVSPIRIDMPKGAEVLTVQRQNELACLWAIVDPNADKEARYFEVHGTGNDLYDNMGVERKYVGTFQAPPFVWHVFERLS